MATQIERLEALNRKLESLGTRRQNVQVKLESARQQLADARAEAQSLHGTSDLGELKAQLAEKENANEVAIETATKAVAEFDVFLTKLEEAMSNPAAMAELLTTLPELPAEPQMDAPAVAAPRAGADAEEI